MGCLPVPTEIMQRTSSLRKGQKLSPYANDLIRYANDVSHYANDLQLKIDGH